MGTLPTQAEMIADRQAEALDRIARTMNQLLEVARSWVQFSKKMRECDDERWAAKHHPTNYKRGVPVSKCAPEPWGWQRHGKSIAVLDSNCVGIAQILPRDCAGEQEAHARIMAKAPDLLTAVENLSSLLFDATSFRDTAVEELLIDIEYGENNPFEDTSPSPGGDPIGTGCSVCGGMQLSTPSGVTCKNGHGGAPPLLPGKAPEETPHSS